MVWGPRGRGQRRRLTRSARGGHHGDGVPPPAGEPVADAQAAASAAAHAGAAAKAGATVAGATVACTGVPPRTGVERGRRAVVVGGRVVSALAHVARATRGFEDPF